MKSNDYVEKNEYPLKLIELLNQVHTLNLKDKMEWNENKLKEMHPIDMMIQIDIVMSIIEKYIIPFRLDGSKRKIKTSKAKWAFIWEDIESEFGIWSHHFNKILRIKIENLAQEKDEQLINLHRRFVYVYAYWWNTYHFITQVLKKRTKLAGSFARKHIEKGRKTLVKLIKDEIDISKISTEFLILIHKLNNLPIESEIKPRIFNEEK